eukprot:scaffold34595_cov110-Skeletonema_dohrnii-CCMP3373.AAC.2
MNTASDFRTVWTDRDGTCLKKERTTRNNQEVDRQGSRRLPGGQVRFGGTYLQVQYRSSDSAPRTGVGRRLSEVNLSSWRESALDAGDNLSLSRESLSRCKDACTSMHLLHLPFPISQ